MAGRELTFSVANDDYVTSAGPTASNAGGSWSVSTSSFKVMVWETEAETDPDNARFNRSAVAAWENISVTAGDYVQILCTKPTKPYHHISVWQQDLSAWNNSSTAYYHTQTITQTGAGEFTITIPEDDDTASLTFGSTVSSFEVNPVLHFTGEVSEKVFRDYKGNLANKSYVASRMYDMLEITLSIHTSVTAANYKKLLDWINDGTRIQIDESYDSPTDNSLYLKTYIGKFVGSDLLHSKHKNQADTITLYFMVESETEV